MGRPTGPLNRFPKVKEARELLKQKAADLLAKYERIIDEAIIAQQFEVAAKHVQWLIEHMPEEDGVRLIDASAAKAVEVQGKIGPSIQIGIALGGMKPRELPEAPEVIDVTPIVPQVDDASE